MLTHVYERIKTKDIGTCNLDPAYFLAAPGLSLQAALKRWRVELELLTDLDGLLMREKNIRSSTFIDMEKLITNTWSKMIKIYI